MCKLALTSRRVERAQAVVAVGLERAHAQLLGQGETLLVVGFGRRDLGGLGVGMEGAKLVQCERLVAAFLVLPGQGECLARVLPGRGCTVKCVTGYLQ